MYARKLQGAVTMQTATHIIGAFGILAAVLAFQCKRHDRVMVLRTANELLFALQYALLGAWTGMAMNLIGCVRNMVFRRMVLHEKDTKWMRCVFSGIFLLFVWLTWAGSKSLLTGFAKVVSTVAFGSSNLFLLRLLTFLTSTCWLIYNLSVGSYTGAVCEVLTLSSIIVGIVRIDIPRLRQKSAQNG